MDLLSFDLNLLLAFDAIYRRQSLSAAAQELNLTQPAMSAALRRMRLHFDNLLFVRTSRGMRPTPFADDIAPKVAHVLEVLRKMDQPTAFSPETTDIHYRVYINDVGLTVFMPLVMAHLRQNAPRARLTVVDLRPDEVVEALDSGNIDLAIGYFLGMPNWARQQNLLRTNYVCVTSKHHPTIGRSLSLEQFVSCRHAMYASSGSLHYAVEQVLARHSLTRDVALTVPRFVALPFLVAENDLIVTLPEDIGHLFQQLIGVRVFKPPLALPDFQIKQYWHERLHAEPAYRWFRGVVHQVATARAWWQPQGPRERRARAA